MGTVQSVSGEHREFPSRQGFISSTVRHYGGRVTAGELYSLRDNIERIVVFIGRISTYLSNTGFDLQDKMLDVAEMSETLKLRIHYGIKEELFDLVLRLTNVGRIRARILFDAGYHTTSNVANEVPYKLHMNSGLGVDFCHKLIKEAQGHNLETLQ